MQSEFSSMHSKVNISFLFFLCLLSGCSFVPNELKTAERIMDVYPDSALNILNHLNHREYKSPSDRALYGLLLFQALVKNTRPLQSDSLINFSINYYQKVSDNPHLAKSYFYKARFLRRNLRYEDATLFYLKALDCIQDKGDYAMLSEIYYDMGDICFIQREYKESRKKYQLAIECLTHLGKMVDISYRLLDIGRTYYAVKDYKTAQHCFRQALTKTSDSTLCGSALQEIGINYYYAKQYDSAQYYLRKSLNYPNTGFNYAIRRYTLADIYYNIEQYDSAYQYAFDALKYPSSFNTQRECYRILVNIEYLRKDIKQMGVFMTHFQSCTDSIRKIEMQTKSTVLEKLHTTDQEANGTKRSMIFIVSILLLVLLLSTILVIFLYKRNKLKREQIGIFKNQLTSKQEFVSHTLTKKIKEAKALQVAERKNATADKREELDKELYISALHLNNWDDFSTEMNHAFNNIIVSLEINYPTINQKEIIWCCLQLLDVSHADRMLVLEATSDSLYKIKQRLAQKMNLKTTKDLDCYLRNMTEIKD